MNKVRKSILVTGSHRSGTTWTGKMLAVAPRTAYIHEPFNLEKKKRIGGLPILFNHWFQYICEENSTLYKSEIDILDRMFNEQYRSLENFWKMGGIDNLARQVTDRWLSCLPIIQNNTSIVKDPIAFFSTEWLAKKFDMKVLVLIRHPAAFCSSLKIKNWSFDFNHFLAQPLLMKEYLSGFEKEIIEYSKNPPDIIDQGILLWNCFHHTIDLYQQKHPEWLFIRHEDLSREPVTRFRSIYESFDLEFTRHSRSTILKTSGPHNPVEQTSRNEFLRNSSQNIYNWKNRLNPEEIDLIQAKTSDIASLFYSEDEW